MRRLFCPVASTTPALSVAATIRWQSATVSAMGFSMKMCLPCSAAAMHCEACSEFGVVSTIASMPGSPITLSNVSLATPPNLLTKASLLARERDMQGRLQSYRLPLPRWQAYPTTSQARQTRRALFPTSVDSKVMRQLDEPSQHGNYILVFKIQ